MSKSEESQMRSYQTRLTLDASQSSALDAYGLLYGQVERNLFSAIKAGTPVKDLKSQFQQKFAITARQFNAVRVGLEGKIDSIKVLRPDLISGLETRISKASKTISNIQARSGPTNKLHQKKRRLHILQTKLCALQSDHKEGAMRLCFGSKKLFHAQFNLEANGYKSHQDWKEDWQAARSSQFFVLGSGDETAGNQSCQATLQADGSLSLMLRLPDAMTEAGASKYIFLKGLRFAYGHNVITAALASSQKVKAKTKSGKPTVKLTGSAISYRFVRDEKGWRVFVSCEALAVPQLSNAQMGAIGVDVNADHLAVSEVDRFGNWSGSRRIDLPTYGKSSEQTKALIGDTAVSIAEQAKAAGKPVVVEKLDFKKKKAELEGASPKDARMLSSFACNKTLSSIKAACSRAGVAVIVVNPAYTSVIGAVNFAQVKGISVHMGAATAIARRGLGLSEHAPKRQALVPTRNGGHVTLCVPARNRNKHVWSLWAKIRTSLKAAHVAHFRSGACKEPPAPLTTVEQSLGAHRSSTARSRGANRQQHCSAGVVFPDISF